MSICCHASQERPCFQLHCDYPYLLVTRTMKQTFTQERKKQYLGLTPRLLFSLQKQSKQWKQNVQIRFSIPHSLASRHLISKCGSEFIPPTGAPGSEPCCVLDDADCKMSLVEVWFLSLGGGGTLTAPLHERLHSLHCMKPLTNGSTGHSCHPPAPEGAHQIFFQVARRSCRSSYIL